jgi:hypothetical protein
MRRRADHALHIRPQPIDFAMDADLAEHAFGQRTIQRHHRAGLIGANQTQRLGRRHQEGVVIDALAAMTIGMHQTGAGQSAAGHPHAARQIG